MNKRRLLAVTGFAALLPATRSAAAPPGSGGPALLTVSGAVGKSNRGALDPVLDQMMVKHGIEFEQAWAFDSAALQRLPALTIRPTLEYDAKVHALRGPLLDTVLRAVRSMRMIVATHADGRPLALGGLGPQWAVYDPDRVAPFKDKPLKERFGLCPWGLYHIDVKAA